MDSTTTTIVHSNSKSRGFSLVEILIVTAIMSIFVAIATSSIVALSQNSTSLLNYQEMNLQSRQMLEQLARDLRGAVEVHTVSDTGISVDTITSDGTQITVTYDFSSSAGLLYRQVDSKPRDILLTDLSSFDLNAYTFRGATTVNPLETKRVQVEAVMERQTLATKNTNYIISAQFVLRNHYVSN